MKKYIAIVMALLAIVGVSCEKDAEVPINYVKIGVESIVPTAITAQINTEYKYNGKLTGIKFMYATAEDFSNALETEMIFTNDSCKVSLTGLLPRTEYYYKYVFSNEVDSYSEYSSSFVTEDYDLPIVSTGDSSSVTAYSMNCGGEVLFDGETPVTARGICWNTSENPTIDNDHTADGQGLGSFSSKMRGLRPATTYYVRAYATNEHGTGYGEQKQFVTESAVPDFQEVLVSDITATTAKLKSKIENEHGTPVTGRGFCWATHQNPTISDSHSIVNGGIGEFSSSINGLQAQTRYYVRAYAVNSEGVHYSAQVDFVAMDGLATVTLSNPQEITTTTAKFSGNAAANGSEIVARGFCWSVSQNPTLADAHSANGSGDGNFSQNVVGLVAGTTYHVRAYATSAAGVTSYSDEKSFTTLSGIPTITTAQVTNITANSARGGGNISAENGLTVASRGICWSTSNNPTLADSHTTDGSGTGAFTSTMTGLSASTTYYVRAYAVNSQGVYYGEVISFTTGN